jgi:hypothetical protein
MKNIALSAVATLTLVASSFAGQQISSGKDYKQPAPEAPCFQDQEFQLDIFASYTDTVSNGKYGDGFGGGVGFNYFFSRYVGFGVDGNVFDAGVNGLWSASGRVILRLPIDSLCLAPYIFGGGGVQANGETVGSFHAGGGLEWRATQTIGLFAEGRYTWTADSAEDNGQARLGVRFVF